MSVRLRVPLLGSGTRADPYDVGLPNFVLEALDPNARTAIVVVPDEDMPAGWNAAPGRAVAQLNGAPAIVGIPATLRASWHAHLDARFKEHAGHFRPDPK